jgi:hypothetical protein
VALRTKPVFDADPMNLFVVVEIGDHHATIMDGDTLEPLTRFPTRFALHGGPKFTPDGRFVYFMSRDGWVEKYDIWSLQKVGEVRAGINARNIALSSDGKHIAVANYLPNSLVLLNAEDLTLERIFDAVDLKGKSSRVSAVYQARPRDSFVVALKDVPEIWEIGTKDKSLPLRRVVIDEPLDDFFFDPSYAPCLRLGARGRGRQGLQPRYGMKVVSDLALPGLPHLGSGITFPPEPAGDGDASTSRAASSRSSRLMTGSRSRPFPRRGRASSCAATRIRPMLGPIR